MKRNIFMIVGNGLTYNCLGDAYKNLNPSCPIHNFNCSNIKYDYLKYMSPLNSIFESYPVNSPNEFVFFENLINEYKINSPIECYIRRFLATAFSQFQIEFDKNISLERWKWLKWFDLNRSNFSGLLSLNYDLVLENILNILKIRFYKFGTKEELDVYNLKSFLPYLVEPLPMFKPHGSIDFGVSERLISAPDELLWKSVTSSNQEYFNGIAYVNIINNSQFLKPRFEMDLIPPMQNNYYRHLDWIHRSYEKISAVMNKVDTIVLFGFSYSFPDRPEFEEILSYTKNKNIEIYDINICPNKELEQFLASKKLKYNFVGDEFPF